MLVAGIIFTTIGVLAIILGFCWLGKAFDRDRVDYGFWSGFVVITGAYLFLFGISLMLSSQEPSKPTAMDVYQNKTELQYTVRGDQVIDSIVVFREESKIRY